MSAQAHSYVFVAVSTSALTQEFLDDIKELFLRAHVTLSPLASKSTSVEMVFKTPEKLDTEKLKVHLMNICHAHQTDAAIMDEDSFRKPKKLVVFDMDSTLIQHEVIDEMAAVYGIGDQVKAITERAMNGELNFDEALCARVALLKGLPKEVMEQIASKLKLSPGVEQFIKTVRNHGYKTAIVSGGFRYFAEHFKEKLKMDYAFANELDWEGDALSGIVKGEIINARKKAELLDHLAELEKIELSQIVAVGDGANDLLMLAHAGLGIAFRAKEKVRQETRHHLSHGPMTTLLYFLGIPGNHHP